jgi:tetratricopeptide (TPR) repeat protein
MGIRFRKSIRLGGGVRLNVGTKSIGLSAGVRGFRYSVNSSGRKTRTITLPGTGLSWVSTSRSSGTPATSSSGRQIQKATHPSSPFGPSALPKPGFFAPAAEKRFYAGVQAFLKGDLPKARDAFEGAVEKDSRNISDDYFAGLIASQLDQNERAIAHLEKVVASEIELPDQLMKKYLPAGQAAIQFRVGLTPRVMADVEFNSVGAALLLAELYQGLGRLQDAIGVIQQLYELDPESRVLTLSLCDLLYEDGDHDGVLEITAGVLPNDSVSVGIVHIKAKSLVCQGITNGALDAFNACLKRTSGIDQDLLMEIRYDRAILYEISGKKSLARRDWERIYGQDRGYRDVAVRIGVG